jgi:hypothetical protein
LAHGSNLENYSFATEKSSAMGVAPDAPHRTSCSERVDDDRLTLASVSNCESANVVVRHDRWSSGATVSGVGAETPASNRKVALSRQAAPKYS